MRSLTSPRSASPKTPVSSPAPTIAAAVTPSAVTPAAVASAAVTPVAVAPAAVTPSAVTPVAVTPAAVTPSAVASAVVASVAVTPEAVTPIAVTPVVGPVSDAVLATSTPSPVLGTASTISALEEANKILREEITKLEKQLRCVLDHSIESDTRLLQFTNKIFVANGSSSEPQRDGVECGVQCDLTCQDLRCAVNRDTLKMQQTTIEVLNAELECLRAAAAKCECAGADESSQWTVVRKKGVPPVVVTNRFDIIANSEHGLSNSASMTPANNKITNKRKNRNRRLKKNLGATIDGARIQPASLPARPPSPTVAHRSALTPHHLSYKTIMIESDSHGRHLAGLVRNLVNPATEVTGSCKPGAKLLNVVSCSPTPSRNCSILIAGTNDLADGQQQTIYKHLERLIDTRLSAAESSVIVATLPLRHDLPYHHHVNNEAVLVNHFIEELCERRGVEVLDINRIGRRWFTRHGMHLRLGGKRLLARLLTECLVRSDKSAGRARVPPSPEPAPVTTPNATPAAASAAVWAPVAAPTPVSLVHTPSRTTSREPVTLPHDTFADAVKKGPTPGNSPLATAKYTSSTESLLSEMDSFLSEIVTDVVVK